jgi:hypothetical protein
MAFILLKQLPIAKYNCSQKQRRVLRLAVQRGEAAWPAGRGQARPTNFHVYNIKKYYILFLFFTYIIALVKNVNHAY